MPTRRTGVLTALLLTAALFAAMPGLVRGMLSPRRVHESLRPPKTQTLCVWLLPESGDDARCIRSLCTAFEKQRRDVRIFLRSVTPDELYAPDAVLPDVALFITGEAEPSAFIPLILPDITEPSGVSGGVRYAVPLWYAPQVLSYPASWGDDPWPMLTRANALVLPSGVALQQLMMTCPDALLPQVHSAALGHAAATPAPSAPGDSLPRSRGRTPTPAPAVNHPAKVLSLSAHQARGEGFASLALSPVTSDRIRYAALCRDSSAAHDFVQFLLSADISGFGLLPPPSAVVPNAFAHTRQEIGQLCMDGFTRLADPAQTLLELR